MDYIYEANEKSKSFEEESLRPNVSFNIHTGIKVRAESFDLLIGFGLGPGVEEVLRLLSSLRLVQTSNLV